MAQLLARMERDGLVERVPDPSDGRSRLVNLTEGALRRLPRAKALMEDASARALAGFSDRERAQLIALLRRVHANLEAIEPQD
jgi:DNA-binding MarR family transcriptional regulator